MLASNNLCFLLQSLKARLSQWILTSCPNVVPNTLAWSQRLTFLQIRTTIIYSVDSRTISIYMPNRSLIQQMFRDIFSRHFIRAIKAKDTVPAPKTLIEKVMWTKCQQCWGKALHINYFGRGRHRMLHEFRKRGTTLLEDGGRKSSEKTSWRRCYLGRVLKYK